MKEPRKKPYPSYFEVPVDNLDRARKFYSEVFDWKIEKEDTKIPDQPFQDYYLITHSDEQFQQQSHPTLLGGMIKRQQAGQSITVYIDVDSLDIYLQKIKEMGGTILGEKKVVPGLGYYAVCKDSENNLFALWEENHSAS